MKIIFQDFPGCIKKVVGLKKERTYHQKIQKNSHISIYVTP